jgi:hypothetical protein
MQFLLNSLARVFVDINKISLNFREGKGNRIVKTIFKNKNKGREVSLPVFKTYYRAIIIKTGTGKR